MGAGTAKPINKITMLSGLKVKVDNSLEVVDLMMPVYYVRTDVTPDDIQIATKAWESILQSKSSAYLTMLKKTSIKQNDLPCIIWFYDTFYNRLFDVHPVSFRLFICEFNHLLSFIIIYYYSYAGLVFTKNMIHHYNYINNQ